MELYFICRHQPRSSSLRGKLSLPLSYSVYILTYGLGICVLFALSHYFPSDGFPDFTIINFSFMQHWVKREFIRQIVYFATDRDLLGLTGRVDFSKPSCPDPHPLY